MRLAGAKREKAASTQSRRPSSTVDVLLLMAMVVLGLGAAVVTSATLTHSSLWLDELTSVWAARPEVWISELYAERWVRDVHPPLYYLALRGWLGAFGAGEAAARSLSLVAYWGILGVGVLAGRRVLDRDSVVVFVMMLACSPAARHYAREARMYEFLILGGVLLAVELSRARSEIVRDRRLSRRRIAGLVLVAVSTSYLHIWGLFMAGGTLLALLTTSWRVAAARLPILVGGAIVVLAYLPWLGIHLSHRGDLLAGKFLAWRPPWETVMWTARWTFGRGVFGLVALVLGVCALVVVWRREKSMSEERLVPTLLLAPALAWLLGTLVSLVVPVFKHYVIVGLAPFVYLAMATGTRYLPRRFSLMVGSLIGFALLLSVPRVPKSAEEWRDSARYVREKCPHGGELFVSPTNRGLHHSRYYLPDRRYELHPVSKDAALLERIKGDGCEVVLWGAHLSRADLDELVSEIGLAEAEAEITEFRRAFVVTLPN